MKKKLLLLCTFLISFIIYIDAVEAAQKLTCVYDYDDETVAVFQDTDGNKLIYINKKSLDFDDSNWEVLGVVQTNIESNYNESNKKKYGDVDTVRDSSRYGGTGEKYAPNNLKIDFTACPNIIDDVKKKKIKLYDEVYKDNPKKIYNENNNLISSYDNIDAKKIIEKSAIKEKTIIHDNGEKNLVNNNYNIKCEYEKLTLYIYDNTFEITIKDVLSAQTYKSEFTFNELMSASTNGKYCPSNLYYNRNETGIYLKTQGKSHEQLEKCSKADGSSCISKGTNSSDRIEAKNCKELFGDDLIKEINEIMKIIRIVVPILLIIFGIIDFFKATFTSSEDDMKKTREKFIKRIVAAVIVFIVPYFVNLVLKLGNMVWDNAINEETCIYDDN